MTEWWQDLFDEKYLKLFAEARDPLRTAQEVEGLMALMQRHGVPAGGEVLDLACGYGRIALPLAELGYRMTGFDLSSVLLDLSLIHISGHRRAGCGCTDRRG